MTPWIWEIELEFFWDGHGSILKLRANSKEDSKWVFSLEKFSFSLDII